MAVMVTSVAVLVPSTTPGSAPEFVLALEPAAAPTVVWTVTVAPVVTSVLVAKDWPWYVVDEPVAIWTVCPLASLRVIESAETLTTVPERVVAPSAPSRAAPQLVGRAVSPAYRAAPPRARPPLLRMAQLAGTAAARLGQHHSEWSFGLLVVAIGHVDERIRRVAVVALASRSDELAVMTPDWRRHAVDRVTTAAS